MVKNRIYLFILIIAAGYYSCITGARHTAASHYSQGLSYDSTFQFVKARKQYCRAIKINPNEPLYYVKRAEATYKSDPRKRGRIEVEISHDYNEAIRVADKIGSPDSIFKRIYSSRIEYHYSFQHYRVAIDQCELMIQLYPDYYLPYLYKGLSHFQMGECEIGRSYLDTAYGLASNKKLVVNLRAEVEYYRGDFRNAILHFQTSDSLGELSYPQNSMVSRAYWQLGKKDSACIYFNRGANRRFEPTGMDAVIGEYCK